MIMENEMIYTRHTSYKLKGHFQFSLDDHKPMNQLNEQLKWILKLMIKNQSKHGL